MKFRLTLNKLDILITTILIILSLILSFCVYIIPKDSGKSVSIYIQNKLEYSYNLSEDYTLNLKKGDYNKKENTYPCLKGDMTIEIKNRKVRVEKEESPLHICSKQGYISIVNLPITCAPNQVVVIIESSTVKDIIITI